MNDIMVDLETMGTVPGSAIISIGAVEFDEHKTGREFYANVDLQSCMDAGLKVSASTIMWWMKQSDDARGALTKGAGLPLAKALADFKGWLSNANDLRYLRVWGNGAAFDNPMLAAAYNAIGEELPWMFWNDRCYRTLKNMYSDVDMGTFQGTAHNALDDAKMQAMHMIRIMQTYEGEFLV